MNILNLLSLHTKIMKNMLDKSKKGRSMEKDAISGLTEEVTMVNIWTIFLMDKACLYGNLHYW